MQLKNPLHLGALAIAAAALLWALSVFIKGLYFPAYLFGLAGSLILVTGLGVPRGYKTQARIGAVLLLLVHLAVVVLFVFVTPVNLGEDPERGFNLQPPAWAAPAMVIYLSIVMPMLLAVFLPLSVLILPSARLERALAATGAAAVILVVMLGLVGIGGAAPARFDYTEDGHPMIARLLFTLAFIAIATACALPAWKAGCFPWDGRERAAA